MSTELATVVPDTSGKGLGCNPTLSTDKHEDKVRKDPERTDKTRKYFDAIRKVGQFAETQLPTWITRKVLKRPHMFDWQLLQEHMKDTMVLAVLNESDGNGSHAVTIHSGYVYDANEVVAIPLCKLNLNCEE